MKRHITSSDFCKATEMCVKLKSKKKKKKMLMGKLEEKTKVTVSFFMFFLLLLLFLFHDDDVYYVDYLIKHRAEIQIGCFHLFVHVQLFTHLTKTAFVLLHRAHEMPSACNPANLRLAVN